MTLRIGYSQRAFSIEVRTPRGLVFGAWSATSVLILAMTALGQEQSPPARLSLQVAFDLAAKQNLDLAAARERRGVALAEIRIAGQRPNPTAHFTALRDEPHEGLFFSQPLELGSKRRRRIEVAEQEARLTDADISRAARQVRRSIREAFYNMAFTRAESERRARVLKLVQRLKQIADQRFQAGDVPRLEVTQAELEVTRAQADFEVAQQREKVSLSQLNTLLNEPATKSWEIAGSLEDLPPKLSLQGLVDGAYASNSDLERLAQEQKIEQRRRALLRAERIPNIDLELGADFNSPHDFAVGPRSQLSVPLPIFSRNQGQIAQSFANQRVLDAEVSRTKRAVAGRVEAAYFDWNARQAQVELYRQRLLPAARNLEGLTEESYRAGKSNILIVLTAQRNVQQAERDYLDSLLAVQTAFAALEENVGVSLD